VSNQQAFRAYMEAKGGRTDCLPVPTDRNQGWPGMYAVLYTDSINGEQTCRDDLWVTTTGAIESAEHEAYADGRKDEAEARAPFFLRALDLIEEAQALAQGIWNDDFKKDERDGLSFNLRNHIREYLQEFGDLTRK
jgi:hypothetical protein